MVMVMGMVMVMVTVYCLCRIELWRRFLQSHCLRHVFTYTNQHTAQGLELVHWQSNCARQSSPGRRVGRRCSGDIRTIACATTTAIGILLTTDMNAGYRKQSVRCGRSIRCDAKQKPSAMHAILLCENNRRSLIILRRRQSTLKPLVCAQRRRACRRSGARGAAGCPGAVDAKRICGCGGY